MVYYPSLPLVMKTEPISQSEFCLPLTNSNGIISDSQMYQQPNMIVQQPITSIRNRIGGGLGGPSSSSASSSPSLSSATINGETLLISPHNVQTFQITDGQNITIYTTTTQTPAAESISQTTAPSAATTTNNGRKSSSASSSSSGKSTTSPTKPQFKCEQCGMTFGSKSAHTSHTKSHAKMEGVGGVAMVSQQINEVPAGIPKTPQIKGNGSGSDPYQCNVCQKTFAVPARLIRHYRTHTGERPFECEFCHKLFSVKENLQVHRRIHTKERPYKCDVCGRAFEHSGKLHRHMRIHTGERPHKCSVCGKTFIQSGQLVIHMRTHTGEKPYKCPVEGCGKGFTCSKQLKVHSRTHTGEKPYHCDICFRDFGYNHVLKLHRVQHYGSKCYKCTICDETFKSKKEMEAHIKGHANEIPDDEENPSGSNQNQAPSSPISMVVKEDPSLSPSSPSSSSIILETDQSRDSGVAISTSGSSNNTGSSSTSLDEMPPEIQAELQQQNHHKRHQKQQQQLQQLLEDQQQQQLPQAKEMISFSNVYHRYQARSTSPSDDQQDQHQTAQEMLMPQFVGRPTINPALLEAASLASRRVLEEDTLKTGRRINSRNETEDLRTSAGPRQSYYSPAPVAEFRSSIPANDIVRQVEAAIAGAGLSPLRSASSASPERSSSPESDSMMMADRDVMTLPLRKRKLYLKDNQSSKTEVPKVMRMSSVIQFAKAS
ncbi:Krueppel homolog 1 isoform X2 [Episyrphus balteatus]|nr:Krueppel homolog 1 isoform X2 [Episyrphus balteatus]